MPLTFNDVAGRKFDRDTGAPLRVCGSTVLSPLVLVAEETVADDSRSDDSSSSAAAAAAAAKATSCCPPAPEEGVAAWVTALRGAVAQLRGAADGELASWFTWLPESSWHVTVFDLQVYTKTARPAADSAAAAGAGSAAPLPPPPLVLSHPEEAAMAEWDAAFSAQCAEALVAANQAWAAADASTTTTTTEPARPRPRLRLRALSCDGFALSARLEPATAADEAVLRRLRDDLSKATGVRRDSDHATYEFHVTLAYQTRDVDALGKRSVVLAATREAEEAMRRDPGSLQFALPAPAFCCFEDMFFFDASRQACQAAQAQRTASA